MFDHFLITRFNLKKSDWVKDKNNQLVMNDSWLKHRRELFLNYCLPSVVGQTSKKFKWLIFFEKGSEPKIEEVLVKLKTYVFIEPIFVDGYREVQDNLDIYLSQRISAESRWLYTTRMDNDDVLNPKFIEQVQSDAARLQHNSLIQFPYGLFLEFGMKNKLARDYYPLNPFLTLIENLQEEELKTVFSRGHDEWSSDFYIHENSLRDAWIQIIHPKNVTNRFKGTYTYSYHLKKFDIKTVSFDWDYNLRILFRGIKNIKILKKYSGLL